MAGLSKKEKREQKAALAPKPAGPLKQSSWRPQIKAFLSHPATSYVGILLLQLKVVWGIWWYREIDTGDTSQYYGMAAEMFRDGKLPLAQSPLYTSFLAALMHLTPDAYVLSIAQRLIIVFALSVMLLAVMRHLLPPGLAWLATAWWVVLPIVFNALYEIHLFALLPLLGALLAVIWKPGRWGRGIAIGLLVAAAALLRNENLVAAVIFGILCAVAEFRALRARETTILQCGAAYGLPLAGAGLVMLFYYAHTNGWGILSSLQSKQEASVCVAIAYAYMERVGRWEYPGSPFEGCHFVMQKLFGMDTVSLSQAFRINPGAMVQHLWWDLRSIPAGLEVLLFNARSGSINPDYVATYHSPWVLLPSAVVLAIVVWGAVIFAKERSYWWNTWIWPRRWAGALLGCLAAVTVVVALMNRPRPSYLFMLGIAARTVILGAILLIAAQRPRLGRVFTTFAFALAGAVLLLPSIYQFAPSDRPILKDYRRLVPFAKYLHINPPSNLVAYRWPYDLVSYVGGCYCQAFAFEDLRTEVTDVPSAAALLDRKKVDFVYASYLFFQDQLGADFLSHASEYGWKRVGGVTGGPDPWVVLVKDR